MRHLVGLHIRYNKSPVEVVERATQLQVPIAQMFMYDENGTVPRLSDSDRNAFLKQRDALFDLLFAHGAYKINCADSERTYHPVLEREIKLAQSFGCTHMILHAGASPDLKKGIDALARLVNNFCKKKIDLKLVFENTAFAGPSIGSDITHFATLLQKIDRPEMISFCIDTAHAHAAGYNLVEKQNDFIHLLETTIGIERIALIHLNDTSAAVGSHIDLHGQLGQGVIGIEPLRSLTLNKKFTEIPLILELPVVTLTEEQQNLDLVNSWFIKDSTK